ncbi:MAG: pseudopilin HpsH [Phormidesmis priestleyi Ana]|uniref:Pseudopilin HpsH n=1 Tax=Phormidesmis priestleyi Ana TaxID=1666911 RepID=A0A0P7YZF7_9CYAN|nr:MAG: pseudopilin HpsH [Phormidesmis priestleyi Ana]
MLQSQRGFTLLEMLVVIFMVGVVMAVAAPKWLQFIEGNRLTVSRDKLYVGIRDAQSKAQRQRMAWQFSIRERNGLVEWASHPRSVLPAAAQWEAFESRSVRIDAETTFASSADIYYVRFTEKGDVQHRLGRLTLSSDNAPTIKRCVIVSTIIGAMRKSKEQSVPRSGRTCY